MGDIPENEQAWGRKVLAENIRYKVCGEKIPGRADRLLRTWPLRSLRSQTRQGGLVFLSREQGRQRRICLDSRFEPADHAGVPLRRDTLRPRRGTSQRERCRPH